MKNRLFGICIVLNIYAPLFSMVSGHKKAKNRKNESIQAIVPVSRNTFPVYRPGATPLMMAAQQDKLKRMQMLLADGCVVDCHDQQGATALTLSIAYGNTRATELLLGAGAYLYHRHKNGKLAFLDLLRSSTPHSLKSFLDIYSGLQIKLRDLINRDDTAGAIRLLSQNNWLAHAPFLNRETPLMLAASKDNAILIVYLLNLGVLINKQDSKKQTALMYAEKNNAKEAKIAMAGYFLYNSAMRNDPNDIKYCLVLLKKVPECARLLYRGKTLLEITLFNQNFPLAYVLINAGVNISEDAFLRLRYKARTQSLDYLAEFLKENFSYLS